MTGTRGPILGIIFGLIYLLYEGFKRSDSKTEILKSLISISLIFFMIIYTPNPISQRLDRISEIDISNFMKIKDSIRERFFYLSFGVEEIKNNSLGWTGTPKYRKKNEEKY